MNNLSQLSTINLEAIDGFDLRRSLYLRLPESDHIPSDSLVSVVIPTDPYLSLPIPLIVK